MLDSPLTTPPFEFKVTLYNLPPRLSGFNTGNSGKEFAFITFEVIDKTYPKTAVEFVAGDYASTAAIKKFAGQDGTGFATLDSGVISSFTAGKNAITVKWNAVPGATEYLLYRKGGEDTKYRAIATSKNISYTDNNYKINIVISDSLASSTPWIIATNKDVEHAIQNYSYRFGAIECIFKNQKTNGFNLEKKLTRENK